MKQHINNRALLISSMVRKISVTGYCGYKLLEEPRSFYSENKQFIITKIIDRSVTEKVDNKIWEYRFRVLCNDQKPYTLCYMPQQDVWCLEE